MKFKPGDRVICVFESGNGSYGSGNGAHFKKGMVGTVMAGSTIYSSDAVRVQFDGDRQAWAQTEELAHENPATLMFL